MCHGFSKGINDPLPSDRDQALKIYLDCPSCDLAFFKTNFTSVNYVNDRTDADVYILVTTIATGNGGIEYTMLLNGNNRFRMYRDTVVFSVSPDATLDSTRIVLLEHTRLGLVPFLMKTPARERLSLTIDEESGFVESVIKQDPWRNWCFYVSGRGHLFSQKTSKNYGLNIGLYVSKVTPEIKFESSNNFGFDESKLSLYDGDSLIFSSVSSQKSLSSSNLFVKSLGDHCGLGGIASVVRSDYMNLDLQLIVGPAVEFNLYKYSDATQKQLRFLYTAKYVYSNYIDSTIFNKMDENLFVHELLAKFMYIDQWGQVNVNFRGTSFLNDWSQYSLGASAEARISLGKGVSFDITGGFSYTQNQVSLKKGAANTEEFLLNQREQEKDFSYTISIGFSYQFGSSFNNVVNPRFSL